MPSGSYGDKKRLAVGSLVFQQLSEQLRADVGIFLPDGGSFEVEFIRLALEEEHAEDEFLKLRSIHLSAKNIGGLKKERLELGEGDFVAIHLDIVWDNEDSLWLSEMSDQEQEKSSE